MNDFVKISRASNIVTLQFNRPGTLNAISSVQDCLELTNALTVLNNDLNTAVVILTGSGRGFCAGGDLKSLSARNGIGPLEQPDSTRSNYKRGVQSIARTLMTIEIPVIAAVNGHAIGLGCDIATLCDIRLASESARFAAGFIKLGIVPGDGGAWGLQNSLGYSRAAEMLFTGETYDAMKAKEFGLVSHVVPHGELLENSHELAEKIAANPVRALRLTKRLLREAQKQRFDDLLELSAAFQAIAHETADHKEALNAMIDKRTPKFTGD